MGKTDIHLPFFCTTGNFSSHTIDDWLLGHVGVSEDIRVNIAFLEFLNILHTLSRMFGRN